MLNPIEKFKSAILHLNRDWNHRFFIEPLNLANTEMVYTVDVCYCQQLMAGQNMSMMVKRPQQWTHFTLSKI